MINLTRSLDSTNYIAYSLIDTLSTLSIILKILMQLSGKLIVITGAASGIGEALARQAAAKGARLVLCDLNLARLQSTAPAGAVCEALDVADANAMTEFAARVAALGGASVVINNAGVALVAPALTAPLGDAHWLMNINFWGVVHGCRAFAPQLQAKPEACLVNISSIFAMLSMPTQSYYNASKAAVRAFSDALRLELASTSVRVLCVHPGGIQTRIVDDARMRDVAMVADSERQLRSLFTAEARTTADQAAAKIIRAIERRQTRLLIGADAVVGDALFRLFPKRASGWLTALVAFLRRKR
jgi:NADP-dependent 3-hydroxy acid dehydrogenase YdfG